MCVFLCLDIKMFTEFKRHLSASFTKLATTRFTHNNTYIDRLPLALALRYVQLKHVNYYIQLCEV